MISRRIGFAVIVATGLLSFTQIMHGQANPPKGWLRAGSQPQNYEMAVDREIKHTGMASARIKFIGQTPEGFGTLMQTIQAGDYRGKRLRMSAWMKTEDADSAQLWMRLDGPNTVLGFDNMSNRSVKGTTDWRKYELVLEVPDQTITIAFGAFVAGRGEAWIDDFAFEVVSKDVLTTDTRNRPDYPKQPVNLTSEN